MSINKVLLPLVKKFGVVSVFYSLNVFTYFKGLVKKETCPFIIYCKLKVSYFQIPFVILSTSDIFSRFSGSQETGSFSFIVGDGGGVEEVWDGNFCQ